MAIDWRVRECVNQLLLSAAFRARAAMLPGQAGQTQPIDPLPPFDGFLAANRAQPAFEKIKRDRRDFELLLSQIPGLPRKAVFISRLQPYRPWQIREVVDWWIRAGIALADWEWGLSVSAGEFEPGPPHASDGPAHEGWLLDLVKQHLVLEDDEEHPVFWIARHVDKWRISHYDPVMDLAGCTVPADSRDRCLADLLKWCGDPGREVGNQAQFETAEAVERWAQEYEARYRDFARAALSLLRQRCRFSDGDPISLRGGDWARCDLPHSPRRFRVLRRPLHCGDEHTGSAVMPGWVTVPWPRVLVDRLAQESPKQPSTSGSISRAIERAQGAWTPADRTFWPVGFPPDERSLRAAAQRIAALGSLAAYLGPEPRPLGAERSTGVSSSSTADHCFRRSWETEGVSLSWVPASDGKGRLVPLNSVPEGHGTGEALRLTLAHASLPPGRFVIGELCQVPHCPDELFQVIEELDWRWWSVGVLHEARQLPAKLGWLAELATEMKWEETKRLLLTAGSPADSPTLIVAHAALNHARLRLTRDRLPGKDAPLADWLAEAVSQVEKSICQLLAAGDCENLARVTPPRDATGQIVLRAWLSAQDCELSPAAAWKIKWEPARSPFGRSVREFLDGSGQRWAVFSAGESPEEADLRWLAAPGLVYPSREPVVNDFADRLRLWLQRSIDNDIATDLAIEIGSLREWCASEGREAFHQLMTAAVAGKPAAAEWVCLLHDDPRFKFTCHPPVACQASIVQLLPARTDERLEWENHDAIARDTEISVTYATNASDSLRLMSRGTPAADSPEALAARLVAAVEGGPRALIEEARRARQATDRCRMFRGTIKLLEDQVVAVSNSLLANSQDLGMGVEEAWECLKAWSRAVGFVLTPDDWNPHSRAQSIEQPTENWDVDFHDTIPKDGIIVRQFGVATSDGKNVVGLLTAVSAGPPPEDYPKLRNLVASLEAEDDAEFVAKLRASVLGFPRRVHSGKAENATAGLFEHAWKAVSRHPEREDLQQIADAVVRMAQSAFRYVAFTPKSLGEVPNEWLQTEDGKQPQGPRGTHIERVTRPGLRTSDNRLILPAKISM